MVKVFKTSRHQETPAMTGLSVYSQPDVVVTNAKVCTPFRYLENYKIAIRDGRILRIRKAKDGFENAQVIDAEGNLVIPGLIDTHIHGIGGFDFRQGKVAIVNIAKILPRFGVTTFLDTLYAVPLNQIGLYTEEARSLMGQNLGAQLLGIHLEGPFFNPNFRGFARRENLAWPSSKIVQDLIQSCHGVVRLVTLSPELDGAVEMIKALTEHGIVTALGHSGAERKQVTKAIEAGLSHVTHIFNAMDERSFIEPGRVRPGLSDITMLEDRLTASVVADGFHVSDILLKLLVKAKGADGIVLISDSLMATAMAASRFVFPNGSEAYVNGSIMRRVEDGAIAGPILTLNEAIRNMTELAGVPLNQAIQMASYNPAKLIRMADRKGSIAEGKDADLVIVDEQLKPIQTIVKGKVVYSK